MPITQFIEGEQREINCFSGRFAFGPNKLQDPIFEGYTTSGYAREYTLSELTAVEKIAAAEALLVEVEGSTTEQASNITGAVSVYGDLDSFIRTLCKQWKLPS